jgi:hypothetical protein
MSLAFAVVIVTEHELADTHLLLPLPSIASELGGVDVVEVELVVAVVVGVVDELVLEVELVVRVVELVVEVVEELVVVEGLVVRVVEVVVADVVEVVEELVVVEGLVVRVVEVVVVVVVRGTSGPTENVAYLSGNNEPCLEYHSPVNVPLNVGGTVCLCEAVRPESIAVRGVQVAPLSVESVA